MSTVPVSLAHLQLSTLAFNRASMIDLRAATTLHQTYQEALTAQQANAPMFSVKINGPGVYADADGKKYLVPTAQLGPRANLPRTPDISFTPNGQNWKMLLTLHLLRPAGSDAAALPLLMNSYRIEIISGDSTPGFLFPTVTPLNPPDGDTNIVGILKAEGAIDAALALTLLKDKSNAGLNITGNLSYRYTFARRVDPPSPRPPIPITETRPVIHPLAVESAHVATAATAHTLGALDLTTAQRAGQYRIDPTPAAVVQTVIEGVTADQALASISVHFDPTSRDFKPIYAAIMGTGSDGTVWSQQTGQGYSRPAPGSNAYYILPDSFRLALDATSGLPSMNLLLVETPPAAPGGLTSYSLRVRLGVAPLLDGTRLERIREALRASQTIPYAQLDIGGYSSATFVPSALFASLPGFQSAVVASGASAAIDAASGFELVLDCSLEFYSLLAKLLCTPDGLQGSVQFQIVTSHDDGPPPVDTTLMVNVPAVLSFIGPAPVKLLAQVASTVPDATAASVSISVTNPLGAPLVVSGVYPTLLNNDPAYGGIVGATLLKPSTDPITLAPGEQQTITVTTRDGGPLPAFTSLATDFGTATPTFATAGVLNHYQDLVASSGISASAHFNCYLLKHIDQAPPSLANLVGMQVEVQHGSGSVVGVPLTRDTPSMDVGIPYTFAELLAGLSLSQPTFQYRAKPIFSDHVGSFSDWIPNTGATVEVTAV